jgi:hypothetical protein
LARPHPQLERLGWVLLSIWLLAQVWMPAWFPSQDGPLHVYIASLMRGLEGEQAELLGRYFAFNEQIEPNIAAHYLLAQMLGFLAPQDVEKLLVSIYVVLMLSGARYAVRAIEPRASFVGLLFLPFALGYFVHKGFYNYCLGTALFLWGLGFWWRHCQERRVLSYVLLALLVGLTTITHLFAVMMLALVIGLARFGRMLIEVRAQRLAALRSFALDGACTVLAFAPGILAVLDFFSRYALTDVGSAPRGRMYLAQQLLTGLPLYSFHDQEYLVALPLLLLVAVLAGYRIWLLVRARQLQPADALLVPLVTLVVLYFANDLTTRDVPVWKRMLPFINFVGLLWLAARPWGPRAARGILAVALLTAIGGGLLRFQSYAQIDELTGEYLASAEHIHAGETFLAIHLHRPEYESRQVLSSVDWVDPYRHVSARVALLRNAVDLRASIISRECYGYFPIVYRWDYDPYRLLGLLLESVPPPIRLADYANSGEWIDKVLVWRPADNPGENGPATTALEGELDSRYEQIWSSTRRSRLELFEHRD